MFAGEEQSVEDNIGFRSIQSCGRASAEFGSAGGNPPADQGRNDGSGIFSPFFLPQALKRGAQPTDGDMERMTQLLEGSPIAALMINCRREIVAWNRAAEILTSIARQDVLGKSLRLASLFRGRPLPLLAELLLDATPESAPESTGKSSLASDPCLETLEARGYITVRDEKKMIRMTASRVRSADGRLLGIVQYAQDVTREELTQRYLMRAQKLESVGCLAGGIIHELNNALMTIQGYSELIHGRLEAQSPLSKYLAGITTTCQRAAGMTRSILDFARPGRIERVAVDLNRLIEDMREMLVQILPASVALNLELAEDLPVLAANPDQLRQVIVNLVVNARDAMLRGGILSIRTAREDASGPRGSRRADSEDSSLAGAPGTYVRLDIADTGGGMSRRVQDRIFEPFFSTKGEGKGTGLGLFVVRSIMESHEGAIWVRSTPGRGSCFHLRLPAAYAFSPGSGHTGDKLQTAS